jgi:hypothetical protein
VLTVATLLSATLLFLLVVVVEAQALVAMGVLVVVDLPT